MIKTLKNIKGTVRSIMIESIETRDNDRLLILKVWAVQNPQLRNKNISFVDFSKEFLKGVYSNPGFIMRTRQKVQEQEPDLRGKYYGKRKKKEVEVREEIGMV